MRSSGSARIASLVMLWAGTAALALAVGAAAPLEALASAPEIPVDLLVLRDVHPLFGGRNLYLNRQGRGVLQEVARSPEDARFRERRYQVRLSQESSAALARVLTAQGFLRGAPPSSRPGIPDESRITLELTVSPDEVVKVTKWSGQDHEAFDAIYQVLLGLFPEIRRGQVAEEVPYDPGWVPEGFKQP